LPSATIQPCQRPSCATRARSSSTTPLRSRKLCFSFAAGKLAWLIREALRQELTGVGLNDDSDLALLP